MAAVHCPDGIKIGPDTEQSSEDDRLPIYDFDEWAVSIPEFVLAAGAQTWLVVENLSTLRSGSKIMAQPTNPHVGNMDKLVVKHVRVSQDGEASILVKNDSDAEVTYAEDQWIISFWNTAAPA